MMTPQEQIRAVLESKGWTHGKPHFDHDGKWHISFGNPPFEFDSSWAGDPPPVEDCVIDYNECPDLLHSLNACHEVFEKDAPDSYWATLCMVAKEESLWNFMRCGKATCTQRIEAYLRDKGLWKD